MTQAEFARQVEQLQGTLYRIAATVLPQLCESGGRRTIGHPERMAALAHPSRG